MAHYLPILNAFSPGYTAAFPSSSSILKSWLYLATICSCVGLLSPYAPAERLNADITATAVKAEITF